MLPDTRTQIELIEDIAEKHFGFKSLDTQNSDHLDFKTLSVVQLRQALAEVYQQGINDARDGRNRPAF